MEQQLKKISCDPMCGFSVQSHDEKEVLNMAKLHVKNVHPDQHYSDADYRNKLQTV
jgi:predicted small metal-binding protein